ncbi:MAG: hypothetical protein ACOY4W_03740 [Thermodesulfobacteriota bacterium]
MSREEAILRELAEIKAMLAELLNPAASLSVEEKGRQMGECIQRYGLRSPEVKALAKKHNGRVK